MVQFGSEALSGEPLTEQVVQFGLGSDYIIIGSVHVQTGSNRFKPESCEIFIIIVVLIILIALRPTLQ